MVPQGPLRVPTVSFNKTQATGTPAKLLFETVIECRHNLPIAKIHVRLRTEGSLQFCAQLGGDASIALDCDESIALDGDGAFAIDGDEAVALEGYEALALAM